MTSDQASPPDALPGAAAARDYQRIARAMTYLISHADRRPALAEVAAHVALSPHHFQRIFTRWAGISAKRFLQQLTLEHAKAVLAGSRSLLEMSDAAGLSGPGRLHDLFVTVEAVTPGEFRSRGAGLHIAWDVVPTRFGPCLLALTPRGICALRFLEADSLPAAGQMLSADWPGAVLERAPATVAATARCVFDPLATEVQRPLGLLVKGTNFQLQVWRALLAVPPGALTTYGRLARHIGSPRAARAVGTAVGANPIAWLVPCHRVIRESGELGGYRWGLERKAAMLAWEAAHTEGRPAAAEQRQRHAGAGSPSRPA